MDSAFLAIGLLDIDLVGVAGISLVDVGAETSQLGPLPQSSFLPPSGNLVPPSVNLLFVVAVVDLVLLVFTRRERLRLFMVVGVR